MKMKGEKLLRMFPAFFLCACVAFAQDSLVGGSQDQEIQATKQQLLELNRDLVTLEEELLFPSDSRLTVFVSMDVEDGFSLDAIKLSVDGKQVTHYVYTELQLDALRRGGLHRLYMGTIKIGRHEIAAEFTGKESTGRDFRQMARLDTEKASGAKSLELKISDSADLQQPQFTVVEW
jgi:hypothetical protein